MQQRQNDKYLKNFDIIRSIDAHLVSRSRSMQIPIIESKDLSQEMILIHGTLWRYLVQWEAGPSSEQLQMLHESFEEVIQQNEEGSLMIPLETPDVDDQDLDLIRLEEQKKSAPVST
eukprot:TRINITY_DN2504_c0_g1_i4.p1 TRINITY_DN2504_c0_g1~~TRINITY_DN2504_c0_g1_i4.p1  ORF type:complete len:117 (-),score=30.92 TRINITY_DN2504_c0_g1_i4:65-415(-)